MNFLHKVSDQKNTYTEMTVDFTLSAFFVSLYKKDKKNLDFLIESAAPKDVMGKVYEILVRENELIPIENLEESEKKELVKECRQTGIQFTNRTLTDAAKILHMVKFIGG